MRTFSKIPEWESHDLSSKYRALQYSVIGNSFAGGDIAAICHLCTWGLIADRVVDFDEFNLSKLIVALFCPIENKNLTGQIRNFRCCILQHIEWSSDPIVRIFSQCFLDAVNIESNQFISVSVKVARSNFYRISKSKIL